MPLLNIQTNAAIDAADRDALMRAASAAVADELGKPERYVMVMIDCNRAMCFAGSAEPTAYLELKSIGLQESQTAALSARLTSLVGKALGVAANRVYIEFASAPRKMWGWDGGTF